MIPEELKYTEDHEWIRIEGDELTIGITDYAQSELGDITFIELPNDGRNVTRSDNLAIVESVKAASDIYAPVSGEISGVNQELSETPELINKDPYGKGWICRLKVTNNEEEINSLMDASSYERYLGGS